MTRDTQPHPTRARRLVDRIALLVTGTAVVGMVAGCGRAQPASGDVRPGAAEGDAVEVVAVDDVFEPLVLEIEAAGEVTVEVRNNGNKVHNLVIEDLDLSTGTIEPGQAVTATFTAPESPVSFVCTFHPGMDGELRLVTG